MERRAGGKIDLYEKNIFCTKKYFFRTKDMSFLGGFTTEAVGIILL